VQREPTLNNMDLGAERPSIDAEVIELAKRRPQPEDPYDFAGKEKPSSQAAIQVTSTVAEASNLVVELHVFKAVGASFRHTVHGPVAWAAPLCTVILANAILAASIMPRLILGNTASDSIRTAVAATSGGVTLLAGTLILLYLLRNKS
jgi:hypothetical protein